MKSSCLLISFFSLIPFGCADGTKNSEIFEVKTDHYLSYLSQPLVVDNTLDLFNKTLEPGLAGAKALCFGEVIINLNSREKRAAVWIGTKDINFLIGKEDNYNKDTYVCSVNESLEPNSVVLFNQKDAVITGTPYILTNKEGEKMVNLDLPLTLGKKPDKIIAGRLVQEKRYLNPDDPKSSFVISNYFSICTPEPVDKIYIYGDSFDFSKDCDLSFMFDDQVGKRVLKIEKHQEQ